MNIVNIVNIVNREIHSQQIYYVSVAKTSVLKLSDTIKFANKQYTRVYAIATPHPSANYLMITQTKKTLNKKYQKQQQKKMAGNCVMIEKLCREMENMCWMWHWSGD